MSTLEAHAELRRCPATGDQLAGLLDTAAHANQRCDVGTQDCPPIGSPSIRPTTSRGSARLREQASARRAMDGRAGQGPEPHRGGSGPPRMVDRPFGRFLLLCYLPAGLMEEEDEGESAREHQIVPRVLEEPERLLRVSSNSAAGSIRSGWLHMRNMSRTSRCCVRPNAVRRRSRARLRHLVRIRPVRACRPGTSQHRGQERVRAKFARPPPAASGHAPAG